MGGFPRVARSASLSSGPSGDEKLEPEDKPGRSGGCRPVGVVDAESESHSGQDT